MESSAQRACNDLMALLDTFKHSLFELAEDQGLTRVQFFVLYWIDRRGELAMGQVAEVLHCDASNVTGVVDRLVTQGLITRQESARDRRTKTLCLTEAGTAAVAKLKQLLPAKLGCEQLTNAEQLNLHDITQKLTRTQSA